MPHLTESKERNAMKTARPTAARAQELLEHCLSALEHCLTDKVVPGDPEWDSIFGAKETAVSVLAKLVSLQKTLNDLQEHDSPEAAYDPDAPLHDADWEALALCVKRWEARKEARGQV